MGSRQRCKVCREPPRSGSRQSGFRHLTVSAPYLSHSSRTHSHSRRREERRPARCAAAASLCPRRCVVAWLRSLLAGSGLPLPLPPPHASDDDLRAALADGSILAAALRRLACALTPDQVGPRSHAPLVWAPFGFWVCCSPVIVRHRNCRAEPRRRRWGRGAPGPSQLCRLRP